MKKRKKPGRVGSAHHYFQKKKKKKDEKRGRIYFFLFPASFPINPIKDSPSKST